MALAALMLTGTSAQAQAYTKSRYYNSRTGHLDYSRQRNMFENGDNYYGLRIGPSFSTVNSDLETVPSGSKIIKESIPIIADFRSR